MSEVHEDYLQASLTSAEALLGVINQVLEYAKLETQEDDNSMHKVDLEQKPFCLLQLSDELCDIVTARVNSRGAGSSSSLSSSCSLFFFFFFLLIELLRPQHLVNKGIAIMGLVRPVLIK